MERLIGKIVNNRYRIQSIVGVGGMAIVYKAIDMQSNITVAIKVLKHEFLQDESFRLRFVNESRAISILNHKNIVKVFDVGLNDDLYYIVMEYLDGITLKQYIRQQGKLSWRETLYFLNQILNALAHAHEKGIIHRDIKPQNMMLLTDGSIKVTDFGIARFATTNTNTMTDKAIGSVHYISPEQVSAERVDARSDLYSVGIMIYEMLTGELPFDAENPVSVALMQLQVNPEPPSKKNPEIPNGMEEIILKCMAKNPDNRYSSTTELMQDIELFKQNPSIKFEYKYLTDDNPTKYVDVIKNVKEDEEFDGDPSKKISIGILAGTISAVVLATFLFLLFITQPKEIVPSDVEIPNLLNQVYETVLQDPTFTKDFRITLTSEEYNNQYDEGIIFSQTPISGMVVKPGADIKVKVSLGKRTLLVPDVYNRDYIQAENEMKRLGLKFKIFREYNDTVITDNVIRCEPEINSEVNSNAEIKIFVSLGKEIKKVQVPALVGMLSEVEARNALNALGLVASANKIPSAEPTGKVLSQKILPDQYVDESTVIEFDVSDGSLAPVKKQITITFPREPATFELTVKQNGEIIHSQTHSASERYFLLDLYGSGTELITVYINDTITESDFFKFSD